MGPPKGALKAVTPSHPHRSRRRFRYTLRFASAVVRDRMETTPVADQPKRRQSASPVCVVAREAALDFQELLDAALVAEKGTGHIRLSLACLRSLASLCPNLAHSFGNLPFCSGRHFAFLSRCRHLRSSSLCVLWTFRTVQLLPKLEQFLIDPFALDFQAFDCKFQ
jgi:hypothetical protein